MTFAPEPQEFPTSPGGWWRLFRTARIEKADTVRPIDTFGLSVDVWTPNPDQWLPPRLKGMLDGLVSAMHFHDGSSAELIRSRLHEHLGHDDWNLLLDSTVALLGVRRLLRPHMRSFAWNPADELCDDFEVRIHSGAPGVEATVFA